MADVLAPFAQVSDLPKGWRPLTTAEQGRAPDLLAKASRLLRAEFKASGRDYALVDPDLLADVVCDMARRALLVPLDQQPAAQVQQSAGGFSMGVTYANPAGEMYLTKAERRKLGLSAQRAGSVDMWTPPVAGPSVVSF